MKLIFVLSVTIFAFAAPGVHTEQCCDEETCCEDTCCGLLCYSDCECCPDELCYADAVCCDPSGACSEGQHCCEGEHEVGGCCPDGTECLYLETGIYCSDPKSKSLASASQKIQPAEEKNWQQIFRQPRF
ncbi:hypothetical protein CAPTEDRAFT_201796 [Capitella teleta]|uniref:Granulins domain-containing protein n=1 Tax=Capitella teleta TaxID=283909 RepID=R7T660_CAPTE|nr:hypothetical protein CAPTEDRAFT_201796 [Capitella teleta]|eukprot:ELT88890.1 hypothetical protein CAPTEDRAFT_201796 [Capitella teleta]